MIDIIELKEVNDELLRSCLRIQEETQGVNVTSYEYLKDLVVSEHGLLLLAFDGEKLVGGAGAKVVTGNFGYYDAFQPGLEVELLSSKVGSLSIMGISPEYQGKGIGQRMLEQRMTWLTDVKGCEILVGISWVSGLGHTSNRVFEKKGFKAIGQIDDFFKASSVEQNLICPVCGDPPCLCPGILYLKRLK